MRKVVLVVFLFLASSGAQASVWDDLKSQEVSQFDYGRLFLGFGAFSIRSELLGQKAGKYEISDVGTYDATDALGLSFSFDAKGKYINPADCKTFAHSMHKKLLSKGLITGIWPNLSGEQQERVAAAFVLQVKLINRDNGAEMAVCDNQS